MSPCPPAPAEDFEDTKCRGQEPLRHLADLAEAVAKSLSGDASFTGAARAAAAAAGALAMLIMALWAALLLCVLATARSSWSLLVPGPSTPEAAPEEDKEDLEQGKPGGHGEGQAGGHGKAASASGRAGMRRLIAQLPTPGSSRRKRLHSETDKEQGDELRPSPVMPCYCLQTQIGPAGHQRQQWPLRPLQHPPTPKRREPAIQEKQELLGERLLEEQQEDEEQQE